MKQRHLLSLLQEGYTTIQVEFEGSQKTYTYKAMGEIKEDDQVIVDSPFTGYTVVKVVGVDAFPRIDLDKEWTYKWIVQKIDDTEYKEIQVREKDFNDAILAVERVRQREILINTMYEDLADDSPARKLLETALKHAKGSLPSV